MLMGGNSMSMILFTYRSQTMARKGARLLQSVGIPSRVGKAPSDLAVRGCGYGIWVSAERGNEAARRLRDGKILYENSYRINGRERQVASFDIS